MPFYSDAIPLFQCHALFLKENIKSYIKKKYHKNRTKTKQSAEAHSNKL